MKKTIGLLLILVSLSSLIGCDNTPLEPRGHRLVREYDTVTKYTQPLRDSLIKEIESYEKADNLTKEQIDNWGKDIALCMILTKVGRKVLYSEE